MKWRIITSDSCIRVDKTGFRSELVANGIHVFQVRLPPNTSDDVDEDPTGNKALWDRGLLNGASQKVKSFLF